MPNPEITVIIPTYNHARYIGEAIESVIGQTIFESCRVIVSDDCSTDRTFDLAEAAALNTPNIIVRRNVENYGIMRHYGNLMKEVRTPFVAILEGDDLWTSPKKLELQRELLQHYPCAGMCFSACSVHLEATGQRIRHPSWNNGRNRLFNVTDLIYDNAIATFSNCFYRSAGLIDVLSSSESAFGYDWLCNLKIAASSQIWLLAEPCTLYRVHDGGTWWKKTHHQRMLAVRESLERFRRTAPIELQPYVDDAIREAS